MHKISLVIPCFNSERSLKEIVEEIQGCFMEYGHQLYEIVLINDGSVDKTWEIIKQCANEMPNIVGINLSKNFGQHNALMAGYNNVSGDIIVGMDDDGEQNPKDIFKLVNELEAGNYDFVCASYVRAKKESWFRNIGTKINHVMAELLIDKPHDFEFTSFYCMRRFLVTKIIENHNPYPYISGLVLQRSRNFGTVDLEVHRRRYGHSGYTFKKLVALWLNGFTAFSVKPLRISSFLGIVTALVGILSGLYLVIRKIIWPKEVLVGYSSIMATLFFVGGVIMTILGIIGEYVGRIYININNSPQYVIKETCTSEDETN